MTRRRIKRTSRSMSLVGWTPKIEAAQLTSPHLTRQSSEAASIKCKRRSIRKRSKAA